MSPHSSSTLNRETQLDPGTEGFLGSAGAHHILLLCPKDGGTRDVLLSLCMAFVLADRGLNPGGKWVGVCSEVRQALLPLVGGWLKEEGSGGLAGLPTGLVV